MEQIVSGHTGSLRLATLSDIHSNWVGLQAVLNHLIEHEQPDAILFLGDYLTDLPDPEKTLDLLEQTAQSIPTVFIRGNREEYLLHDFRPGSPSYARSIHPSSQTGSLAYTASRLSEKVWTWLEDLPDQRIIKPGDAPALTLCHGSLLSSRELLYPGTQALQNTLELLNTRLLLHGHTHHRSLIQQGDKQVVDVGIVAYNTRPEPWSEERFHAYLKHPQPGQETVYASTVILDWEPGDEDYTLRFVDVPYDPWEIVRDLPQSELAEMAPWWSRAVIREMLSGKDYILALVLQAGGLARAQGITGGHIPEAFFEESFKRITEREHIDVKHPENLKPFLR